MIEKHKGMKKLTFWVDENLHSELKLVAIMESQPMQEFIVEAIDEKIDRFWDKEQKQKKNVVGRFRIEKALLKQPKPE